MFQGKAPQSEYESIGDANGRETHVKNDRNKTLLRVLAAVYAITMLGFAANAYVNPNAMGTAPKPKHQELKNSVVSPESCGVPGANANSHSLVCQNYGEVTLSKGKLLANTAVSQEGMSIFLDITIHKLSSGWSNILLIGEDKLRQPLLGLNPDGFRVAYSGGAGAFNGRDAASYKVPIGKRIRLHIDRQGKEVWTFLEGAQLLGILNLEDEDMYENCNTPIYASKEGGETVSDVTIHELIICPFAHGGDFDAMCIVA